MQRFQARLKFESFVNSEECKTNRIEQTNNYQFESFVNSEECKTISCGYAKERMFESFVNSEECKTRVAYPSVKKSLRALLIQKSVKLLMRSKS